MWDTVQTEVFSLTLGLKEPPRNHKIRVVIFCPVSEKMPEKGYSQRTKIRDKGSFPKVPDCHGYNSYIGVDPTISNLRMCNLIY